MIKRSIFLITIILALVGCSSVDNQTESVTMGISEPRISEENLSKTDVETSENNVKRPYEEYIAESYERGGITKEEMLKLSAKRNLPTDENFADHAKLFIDTFREDYPNAYITKLRWQKVLKQPVYTYIVEGIEGETKHIVKYLIPVEGHEGRLVLGSVSRDLNAVEYLEDGSIREKALDIDMLLSFTEIEEISLKKYDGLFTEITINWGREMPIAKVQVTIDDHYIHYMVINAITGEEIY